MSQKKAEFKVTPEQIQELENEQKVVDFLINKEKLEAKKRQLKDIEVRSPDFVSKKATVYSKIPNDSIFTKFKSRYSKRLIKANGTVSVHDDFVKKALQESRSGNSPVIQVLKGQTRLLRNDIPVDYIKIYAGAMVIKLEKGKPVTDQEFSAICRLGEEGLKYYMKPL